MLISTDDGVTWSVLSTIATSGVTEEIAATWIGGNTILLLIRTGGNTPVLQGWSYDAGATWSTATTNLVFSQSTPSGSTGLNHYEEVSPWIINDNPGVNKITLLWCERGIWNNWPNGPSNVSIV